MKQLSELVAGIPGARILGNPSTAVRAIRQDSRAVEPGDLFVAIPGARADGLRFVGSALARGAAAIVCETETDTGGVPAVLVPDARAALGEIAAAFYDQPSLKMRVVGVTGTDGKTSTTHILQAIFEASGERTGLASTVRLITGEDSANPTGLTTPDAIAVQASLAGMVAAGRTRAVLEVSSHALIQSRVDAVHFRAAVCTNIDPEHLDYHGDFASYIAAKGRLFELVAREGGAIVRNADSLPSLQLPHPANVRELSFGFGKGADIRAENVELGLTGTAFTLVTSSGAIAMTTGFTGRFNVANWLAAAAVALAEGVSLEAIQEAGRRAVPVDGRMQMVDAGQPFRVVVDFAHTPQALENALLALESSTPGKLFVVFGHAGERDAANRPRMGAIAARNADVVIITMDDPYSEDPSAIADEIQVGINSVGKGFEVYREIDRREAMRLALGMAGPGDTVLIAGRGHESVIEWGDRKIQFSDPAVARELLTELGYSPC